MKQIMREQQSHKINDYMVLLYQASCLTGADPSHSHLENSRNVSSLDSSSQTKPI